jgi:hypothetical protein
MAAAGVTPLQIYKALLAAGASTIQAIGIMANSINESGLNPEATNPSDGNGGSYGFVQQNGGQYATLVTGNPVADLAAQIKVVAVNGGFAAASGTTPAQAAGNFASGYERCVGCQAGGAQYTSRVANAATVAGWVASGSWPTSAGSTATTAATSSSGTVLGGTTDPTCAFGIHAGAPGLSSLPIVGSAFQADLCFMHKSTVRHVVGGLLMLAGGGIALPGVLLLAAFSFRRSGAGHAAGGALETIGAGLAVVPGAEAAGLGLAAAGHTARRAGSSSGAAQSVERRRARRASEATQRQAQAASQQRQTAAQGAAARRAAGSPANQQRAAQGRAPVRQAARPVRAAPPPAVHHD